MNFTQFVRDYLATHPNLGLTFHQAMKDERVKCAFHEEKVRRCNEGIRDPPEPPRQPRQRRNRQDGDVIVNVNCGGTQPQTAQGRVPGVGPRGGPGGMPPPPPPGGLGPPGNLLPPFPVQSQPPRQQPPRQDEVEHIRTISADEARRRDEANVPVVDLTSLANEINSVQRFTDQLDQPAPPNSVLSANTIPINVDEIEDNLSRTTTNRQINVPSPLNLPPWEPIQLNQNIQPPLTRTQPRPRPTFTSQPANIFSMPPAQRERPSLTQQRQQGFSMQPIDPYAQSRDARDLLEMYTIDPENPNYVTQGDIIAYDRITQGQRQELQNQLDRTSESFDAAMQLNNQLQQENAQVQEIQRVADEHEQRAIGLENRLVNATEQGMEMRRRVEELEEQVQNAVTPEQQEHARRDYENQINRIQQESQRVQEDYRRQLAESQQQLQQGIAEADAAIDGMRRRYNELAEANNAQYQQRLRTLQQLQQQMQYEDEQGKQRLQQQIQDHEQKMQGELATARAYSEAMTKHALNLLETKNHIQNQLDLHQYAGDYRGPSVIIGEDGIPRYDEGGFSNIQFFESPNRVRELPEQREMGTQMEPEPEPEPMQIDDDAIYPYTRNPMRPGYVRNEVRRIDDGRRPPPPQQPRLFGLAPSPISGQPTFQPSRADISYEDSASRIDAPPRAGTPPRGVRRQREPDMNPVNIAADRIQTIMETGERGPERDAALTRSIYGLERNQLNQLRAQLRARGLYDNVTIRNGKIFGNGLKKKTKK